MMKKKQTVLALAMVFTLFACKEKQGEVKTDSSNPLLVETFNTPFEVPPFDLIKDEHFEPAILDGIAIQQKEIDAIVNNTAAPTFENTIEALENSGALYKRTTQIFYNLTSANTNEKLQEIAKKMSSKISEHAGQYCFE